MKPVLIINYNKYNDTQLARFVQQFRYRTLETENVFEALKITKYVAPGMVISNERLAECDLGLIKSQIFNNMLAPCIAVIFYNFLPNITNLLLEFSSKRIRGSHKKVFIEKKILIQYKYGTPAEEFISTFN